MKNKQIFSFFFVGALLLTLLPMSVFALDDGQLGIIVVHENIVSLDELGATHGGNGGTYLFPTSTNTGVVNYLYEGTSGTAIVTYRIMNYDDVVAATGRKIEKVVINEYEVDADLINVAGFAVGSEDVESIVSGLLYIYHGSGQFRYQISNPGVTISGDLTITFVWTANSQADYAMTVISSNEELGSVFSSFMQNTESGSQYSITATPTVVGYVFDYWEYTTTVENPQESDWQRDYEHTSAIAIIEIKEVIWYRAQFRPTSFTMYVCQAFFGAFEVPSRWYGHDPEPWYYEDYALTYIGWSVFDSPSGDPVYVGGQATLVLPVLTIDGTLPNTLVSYWLYFGDAPVAALSGMGYTSVGWADALLYLNFYVREMPDVSSVTLKVSTADVEGNLVTVEQVYGVAPVKPVGDEPLSVSFRLIGSTLSTGDVDFWSDGVDYNGAEYQTWIATKTYTMQEGDSVYELFVLALADAGLGSVGADSNYVSAIFAPDCLGGYRLAEFDNGMRSGWMYTVNGVHVGFGLKEQLLHDGDVVIWHYVNDYLYEVSDWFYGTAGDASMWSKWLEALDVDPLKPVVYGDVNGDGVVNRCDQTVLNQYFSGTLSVGAVFIMANADVNGDGVFNRADQTRFNQYFSGIDPSPLGFKEV